MEYSGLERRTGDRRQPAGFRCPSCGAHGSDVVRVSANAEGTRIYRRHECRHCHARFSSTATICATGSVADSS